MHNLKDVSDADLLTMAGLLAALLSLAQSKGLLLVASTTLHGLTEAIISELTDRNRLQDATDIRVMVIADGQLTECSSDNAPDVDEDDL